MRKFGCLLRLHAKTTSFTPEIKRRYFLSHKSGPMGKKYQLIVSIEQQFIYFLFICYRNNACESAAET